MQDGRITEAIQRLLQMFETGEFPEAAARTFITRQAGEDKPCLHWSLGNQLLMLISGTADARGFRQWKEIHRNVNAGSKAIYILAPLTRKVSRVIQDESGQERKIERQILFGFRPVPVFRLEDTDGEPLPQIDYNPLELPPLMDVAKHFGIVRYAAICGPALGSCSPNGNITLYSHDVDVFFHELAHQVHNTIKPLKAGQHDDQEIIAEMCSCILCEMYGYKGYIWHGWEYIRGYGGHDPQQALRKVMGLLGEVDSVVSKILGSLTEERQKSELLMV